MMTDVYVAHYWGFYDWYLASVTKKKTLSGRSKYIKGWYIRARKCDSCVSFRPFVSHLWCNKKMNVIPVWFGLFYNSSSKNILRIIGIILGIPVMLDKWEAWKQKKEDIKYRALFNIGQDLKSSDRSPPVVSLQSLNPSLMYNQSHPEP